MAVFISGPIQATYKLAITCYTVIITMVRGNFLMVSAPEGDLRPLVFEASGSEDVFSVASEQAETDSQASTSTTIYPDRPAPGPDRILDSNWAQGGVAVGMLAAVILIYRLTGRK